MNKKIIGLALCSVSIGIFLAWKNPWSQNDVSPWPEYEPVDELLISSHLFEFQDVADTLLNIGRQTKVRLTVLEDLNTTVEHWDLKKKSMPDVSFLPMPHSNVWIRDFGPINLDMIQKSTSFSELAFADLTYQLDPTLDDILPWQLSLHLRTSLIKTPFVIDGGNFIATRDDCFLSDHFLMQQGLTDPSKAKNEMKAFAKMISREFGCEVKILKNSPHAHVDMFLKPLSADSLLISEISPELIEYLKLEQSPYLEMASLVQKQLNDISEELGKEFKVHRIPMPAPIPQLFRNYTNSILIGSNAIVPSYSKAKQPATPYIDEKILGRIEETAMKTWEQLGFSVFKVNADQLIAAGGALHCVALTLPKRGIKQL